VRNCIRPTQVAQISLVTSVDGTSASNVPTRTYLGVSNLSAQAPDPDALLDLDEALMLLARDDPLAAFRRRQPILLPRCEWSASVPG
jgi:hypothetical protein